MSKTSIETTNKTSNKLTLKQDLFCKYFSGALKTDEYTFGNGSESYIQTYRTKNLEYARFAAHRLLTNQKIIDRINELLEEQGFNNENVDKQHLFLINQNADLRAKLGAISEYNKLRKRIDKNQTIIFTGNQITFDNFTHEPICKQDISTTLPE